MVRHKNTAKQKGKLEMRYCDKCGAAITSGGHKSAASGIFGQPYLCDSCSAAEDATVAMTFGCFAKLVIGALSGLGTTIGVCALLSKLTLLNKVHASPTTVVIAIESLAVVCFIASKIGSRILRSKFLRFACRVIAYFSLWMSLVHGVAMYFIIKYYN